jgi:hypothetical protein
MDEEAYHSASQRARRFAEKWLSSCSYRRESTSLFEAALAYAQAEQMMGSNSRF